MAGEGSRSQRLKEAMVGAARPRNRAVGRGLRREGIRALVAENTAAAAGCTVMIAPDGVCAAQRLKFAQRLEKCRAQRTVEGDVEGGSAKGLSCRAVGDVG